MRKAARDDDREDVRDGDGDADLEAGAGMETEDDDDDGSGLAGGAQGAAASNAAGMVVRLAVTLSLTVARALLHTPTDRVLSTVADLAIVEAIRARAHDAAERRLDLAGIADELVRASGRALRDTGLSRPEFEMTGEAFSTVLRLATQFSDPTKDVSADDMYDAAHAYAHLFRYGRPRAETDAHAASRRRHEPRPPVAAVRRYARAAMAVYGTLAMKFLGVLSRVDTQVWSNTQAIQYLTGIDTETCLVAAKWRANWVGSIYRPGYFVLLDHAHKEVILAVRGSYRFQDALTDLMCEDTDFTFHYRKQEDLESAQRELEEVFSSLAGALAGLEGVDAAAAEAEAQARAGAGAGAAQGAGASVRDTAGEVFRQLQGWVARQSQMVARELQEARAAAGASPPPSPSPPPPHPRATAYLTRDKSRARALSEEYPQPTAAPAGHRHVRGRAHFGFLKAAQALAAELEDTVAETMRAHRGYQLVLVGHSLGSAVATLMTLMWSHHPDLRGARCVGVAAPSCVSQDIAESPVARARVTSIVLGDDVVPRLSLGSVSDLRNAIVHCACTPAPGEPVSREPVRPGAPPPPPPRTVARMVLDEVAAAPRDGAGAVTAAGEARLRALFEPVLADIRAQELVHDKLLPAGVVWHIPSLDAGFGAARQRPCADFGELVLAPGMFDAHLPQRYAFACCDKLPLSEADAEAARELERRESARRGSLSRRLSRALSRLSGSSGGSGGGKRDAA